MKYIFLILFLVFSCTSQSVSVKGTIDGGMVTTLTNDAATSYFVIPALRHKFDGETVYKQKRLIFQLPSTFVFKKSVFTGQANYYVFSDSENMVLLAFSIDGNEITCEKTTEIHEKLEIKSYDFCNILKDEEIFTMCFTNSNYESDILIKFLKNTL